MGSRIRWYLIGNLVGIALLALGVAVNNKCKLKEHPQLLEHSQSRESKQPNLSSQ